MGYNITIFKGIRDLCYLEILCHVVVIQSWKCQVTHLKEKHKKNIKLSKSRVEETKTDLDYMQDH